MNDHLNQLNSLINWYKSLPLNNQELMNKPIAEGKFAVKEIIAHLYRWDEFLLKVGIPSSIESGKIDFPNFHDYNHESAKLVSEKGIEDVITQAIKTREDLVKCFIEYKEYALKQISMNGKTHIPNTEKHYTFYYLIEDFSEHDQHHKKQIEEFLHNQRSNRNN